MELTLVRCRNVYGVGQEPQLLYHQVKSVNAVLLIIISTQSTTNARFVLRALILRLVQLLYRNVFRYVRVCQLTSMLSILIAQETPEKFLSILLRLTLGRYVT